MNAVNRCIAWMCSREDRWYTRPIINLGFWLIAHNSEKVTL